ncbi:crotonase [Clostridiales bacterium PH28_bin88]|nr:crotonase [Clostridiales bacterium PH28_bin88]
MSWENILLEKEDGIAVLTINRPKALNALNAQTFYEMAEALEKIANDPEIKVLILTGAGEKSFVAGADIVYMKDFGGVEGREFALLGQRVMNMIEKLPQPVIAAVNGYALGGGCELAMCCDIRIAAENARFGQPEVALGVIPGFAGTQRLPRLVGKAVAKELLLTGEQIPAERAWQVGLVNHVVPASELLARAKAMAKRISANGQLAVKFAKEAVNNGLEMDVDRAMAYEADLFGLCFSTADRKEGMAAFVEKRKPQFQGK